MTIFVHEKYLLISTISSKFISTLTTLAFHITNLLFPLKFTHRHQFVIKCLNMRIFSNVTKNIRIPVAV